MKKNRILLEGRFDVRNYNANLPREQWTLKGETDAIRFTSVSDEPLKIEGADFAKELTKDETEETVEEAEPEETQEEETAAEEVEAE